MKKAKKTKGPAAPAVEEAGDEVNVSAGENVAKPSADSAEDATLLAGAGGTAPSDLLDLRMVPRESVELKTIIQVKEQDETWKETAVVNSVSKAGAGFNLSRPCTVGRLITLVMPLPSHLRAYDFHERLYPVLAVVQYCHEINVDGETSYNVGAAFIGKKIPSSYLADPCQNYRLTGMGEDGLWKITEAMADFKVRKHSRFWVEIEVSVTILQRDRKAVCKDVTTTQDISAGGASMRSSVAANIGDKVKFTCKEYNFFSMAVVRGRSVDGSDQPTLHVEFLDAKFPVHLLPKPEEIRAEANSRSGYVPSGNTAAAVERF
jgi:hypothetical protein